MMTVWLNRQLLQLAAQVKLKSCAGSCSLYRDLFSTSARSLFLSWYSEAFPAEYSLAFPAVPWWRPFDWTANYCRWPHKWSWNLVQEAVHYTVICFLLRLDRFFYLGSMRRCFHFEVFTHCLIKGCLTLCALTKILNLKLLSIRVYYPIRYSETKRCENIPSVLCVYSAVQNTHSAPCSCKCCRVSLSACNLWCGFVLFAWSAACDDDSSCLKWCRDDLSEEARYEVSWVPTSVKICFKNQKKSNTPRKLYIATTPHTPHSCHFRCCFCLVCFRITTNKTHSVLLCRNNAAPVGHSRPPVTSKVSGSWDMVSFGRFPNRSLWTATHWMMAATVDCRRTLTRALKSSVSDF